MTVRISRCRCSLMPMSSRRLVMMRSFSCARHALLAPHALHALSSRPQLYENSGGSPWSTCFRVEQLCAAGGQVHGGCCCWQCTCKAGSAAVCMALCACMRHQAQQLPCLPGSWACLPSRRAHQGVAAHDQGGQHLGVGCILQMGQQRGHVPAQACSMVLLEAVTSWGGPVEGLRAVSLRPVQGSQHHACSRKDPAGRLTRALPCAGLVLCRGCQTQAHPAASEHAVRVRTLGALCSCGCAWLQGSAVSTRPPPGRALQSSGGD